MGLSQAEDLNSKNYEGLKMEQYGGKKTPPHYTLGPLAHHFETQLNK